MEPEARYTMIGSVLLAIIVALVAGFVWLSSSGRASDFRFYTIYFERQSLEGLQVGGDVNMRGVKVGRIENFTISRDNINKVKVAIRVARATPVSENTTAVVARSIVTGLARINLDTPGTPGPELVTVAAGERYPVITEGTSNLDQIADSVSKLASQADIALENLNSVMGDRNKKSFAQALTAIRDLSVGLNRRLETIDEMSASFQASSTAFQGLSRDLSGASGKVANAVAPVGDEASQSLREANETLKQLRQSTANLEREVVKSLAVLNQGVAGLSNRTDDAVDVGLNELRATTADLRSSLAIVSRTLDRLQDPKAILIGPSSSQLGPGEEAHR
jgi:phospholipid/cholesterol/gamma-HCH transport system substrate-binding protein